MKCLPQAQSRHLESIENWFDGNKPLVRSESGCYHQIRNETDYVALEKEQNERAYLEILLELGLRTFPKLGNLVSDMIVAIS
jgi:Fe-S oxidoreductase